VLVPALAAAPALAGSKQPQKHTASHVKKVCPKPKKGAHGKAAPKCKVTKPVGTKGTKKKPRPSPTKTVRVATAKPTRTPTRNPTRTPTATATFTPSPTPTTTATPSPTPVPPPSIATLSVVAGTRVGYQVAFSVCGMPQGVTAAFAPMPAPATHDSTFPAGGSASGTLTTSTAYTVVPATYTLSVRGYLEDSSGGRLDETVSSQDLRPATVFLTVHQDRSTTLSGSSVSVPSSGETCSPVPAEFLPTPTPTPARSDVTLTASISTEHPGPGGVVTVHATVTVRGQPVAGVIMHVKAYASHGIKECDGVTQQNGVASCNLANNNALPGYGVEVQVLVTYNGYDFTAYAAYVE
jgi:hypothetical protein